MYVNFNVFYSSSLQRKLNFKRKGHINVHIHNTYKLLKGEGKQAIMLSMLIVNCEKFAKSLGSGH